MKVMDKKAHGKTRERLPEESLRRQLVFYKGLSLALFAGLIFSSAHHVEEYLKGNTSFHPSLKVQADAPHADFVREALKPLRYTGLPDFLRSDVSVSIDFQARAWSLRNIHRFDENGRVILNEGRYGVCGDLAAYAYQKIKPVFGSGYKIEFLKVADSSFFKPGAGSHIILRIIDLQAGSEGSDYRKVYLLDPALRRYGVPELFPDYWPEQTLSELPFAVQKNPDETFVLGEGPPILINRNAFVMLQIKAVDGKFDRDNFRFVLAMKRRYEYSSESLFEIGKKDGRPFQIEPDIQTSKYVRPATLRKLIKRTANLFLEAGLQASGVPGGTHV